MAHNRFKLKLATLKPGSRYLGLAFRHYVSGRAVFEDPVISHVCGENVDYGKLFAYCFRRFGYPNSGWDDHKELTAYLLTTPHPGMVLEVVPYVGGASHLQFRFLVLDELYGQVEAYGRRERMAWEKRAQQWAEARGLPEWMEEWQQFCNRPDGFASMGGASAHWTDTIRWMSLGPVMDVDDETSRLTTLANAFHQSWLTDYQAVEACPSYVEREADWTKWNDADPLKALAEAAQIALRDFHRPVGVRDQAINTFGECKFTRGTVDAAGVAGYPSGDLGNAAPKEFAELHGLIVQLGGGNAKKGIQKATHLVQQALKARK